MMYKAQKTLFFFSSVVKNVASPNLEIKKLVYIYLLHHAEQEPDLALLSINTIQKSLSDSNPQVRALALRTMSGIRVPVISQIVSLAIKKGCGDMSPYVRRAAALAVPKCFRLDPSQLPQLVDYLATLLGDRQYYVAGAAVAAFLEVCPDRIDLVHKHYRALVRQVVDMDEWSQMATLRLMTVYARKCFPRRTVPAADKGAKGGGKATAAAAKNDLNAFYGEETGSGSGSNADDSSAENERVAVLDPDLQLLLNGIKPLLQSRNSGVVLGVARVYSAVGTPDYLGLAVGPLVSLLRGPPDVQQVVLYNVVAVCLAAPREFVRYATHFLVRAAHDPPPVWELKIEVLALIFQHCPPHLKGLILSELEHFARGGGGVDKVGLVREAVRAIGRCAQTDPSAAPRCLRTLLGQISSLDGALAAESLTVIRHLIQLDPAAHGPTVVRLAKNLDSASDPEARAAIVWLVGEFAGLGGRAGEDNIAADVLRILVKDFAAESEPAKLQIVLLGAKVYLHHLNRQENSGDKPPAPPSPSAAAAPSAPSTLGYDALDDGGGFADPAPPREPTPPPAPPPHPIALLWEYLLLLVRYDVSYDVRDRARLYKALLAVPQLATLMLLAPKPAPAALSPSETRRGFTLGSAALVLGGGGGVGPHGLRGYEALPDWVAPGSEPDPRLREPEGGSYGDEKHRGGGGGAVPAAERLDAVAGAAARPAARTAEGKSGGSSNGVGGAAGLGEKSLDDWLAEGDDEDDEEEEEDDEDEEEETEGETDDEEDDEEEEEEEEDGDAEHNRLVKGS